MKAMFLILAAHVLAGMLLGWVIRVSITDQARDRARALAEQVMDLRAQLQTADHRRELSEMRLRHCETKLSAEELEP